MNENASDPPIQIQVDHEVFRMLEVHAHPFVDSPNSVLRRLLGLEMNRSLAGVERTPTGRLKAGQLLPHKEYELPILATLEAMGGSARTRDVLRELGSRLDKRLTALDKELLRNNVVRWANRAQFVRFELIKRGDLLDNSPRGVWELSEQGRRRLAAEAAQ